MNNVRNKPLTDRIALGLESFKHYVAEGREGIGQRAREVLRMTITARNMVRMASSGKNSVPGRKGGWPGRPLW